MKGGPSMKCREDPIVSAAEIYIYINISSFLFSPEKKKKKKRHTKPILRTYSALPLNFFFFVSIARGPNFTKKKKI